jgi:hypothetical protein
MCIYLQFLDLLLVSGLLGAAERGLRCDAITFSLLGWRTAGALPLQREKSGREMWTRGKRRRHGGRRGRRGRSL